MFGNPLNLPDVKDEDNPIVWCERCKRHHKYYTFTKQDYERIVADGAKRLAEHFDRQLEKAIFNEG